MPAHPGFGNKKAEGLSLGLLVFCFAGGAIGQ
jgi:hypothetical protein